jgi:hypothetical protein
VGGPTASDGVSGQVASWGPCRRAARPRDGPHRGPAGVVEDGSVVGDRWGVSEHEVVRSYPCDDFVSSPRLQAWRGVWVQAPAEVVWPWVAQVRLAPYSYDWIDNRGRRSPRELAGLPEPRAGDRFTTAGGCWAGSSRLTPASS